ncbi:proteasome regulatory particle lid subunit RPN9 [Ascoidea rubescens DSM 1968]|uniref:PCI-domain-containing protein n=1 Tax=Ascoidea rubescens DSM 1968 TaxID=1344418 RepID=A0A1D2VCM9_9ASCO|nr:PCI-domain-containing protein [Ascoidea rubescens DSM 1968]ODV59260.1 PCI-domain-containing protein [Ascoidea rubescens DSM 1968]
MADQENEDASTVLATLRIESNEDLIPFFYTFEDYYERKLWHQLTKSVDEFFHNELSKPIRVRLFHQFILKFYQNINQLKFVQFALTASSEIESNEEKLFFLQNIKDKLEANLPEDYHNYNKNKKIAFNLNDCFNKIDDKIDAFIFLQIEISRIQLFLNELEKSREILDKMALEIDLLSSINNVINASFYSTNAQYYKLKNDYNDFYKNSLLYLACLDSDLLNELSEVDKQLIAYDLSIAALLGDKIYNFGELLLHDILNSLKNDKYSWLRDFLFILNSGDLNKFESVLSSIFEKSPLLLQNEFFLKQKICLMALIELIFQKPNGQRVLTFNEISKTTRLPINDVEHLVMRALSLNLLKGFIDQVNNTITVTWVQPRIMNIDQVESMRDKLDSWSNNVENLAGFMRDNGNEIWTFV